MCYFASFFFLLFVLSCHSPSTPDQPSSVETTLNTFPSDPMQAQIVTTDIDAFWEAYDLLMKDTSQNPLGTYIREGSPGVKNFISNLRIVSPTALKKLVLAEKDYYANIRSSTYQAKRFEKQIMASHLALKELYPPAIFPPVYFLIGRTTSGGTASKAGLSIGLEVFSETPIKTNYGRPSLDLELLPFLVAHEIIHFLQNDVTEDETLLKHCIREGSADFISEMTAGEKVRYCNGPNVYAYGDQHEAALWQEFKTAMFQTDYAPWLYSQTEDGRPQNLGYWMGYKIVEAYYQKMSDKRAAINDIINISDFKTFFEKSGYGQLPTN